MQAFHLTTGPRYVLTLAQKSKPEPRSDEVLIRIRAAALNYLDLAVARGQLGNAHDDDFVPGTDGAGEIVAVGDRVRGWKTGNRVIAGLIVDWAGGSLTPSNGQRLRGVTMPGSLAEYAVVPASALVEMPAAMSFEQAAALPVAATTAWNAIVAGEVRPGSIVVLPGTGGVSLFALSFAKAAGARVIVTSSSDEKLERARALGADVTINYRTTPDWDAAVLDATGGRGADLIVETVGGANFPRSVNAAAIDGTIFVIGFVAGMEVTMPVLPVMTKKLRIIGNQTGSTANLADAVRAIEQARIEPVIDRTFPFDQAADAYAFLESGGHFGKVVIAGV